MRHATHDPSRQALSVLLVLILAATVVPLGGAQPTAADPLDPHPAPTITQDSDLLVSPYQSYGVWLAGDTHVHTVAHGDGMKPSKYSALYTGSLYRQLGFGFIVVTDHDHVTELPELDGFTFISGAEITTRRDGDTHRPHQTALNITTPIPWQVYTEQEIFDQVDAQGGLAVMAHPNAIKEGRTRVAWSLEDMTTLTGYAGFELYNHIVEKEKTHRSSGWAIDNWWAALSAGRQVWGFAVDDVHRDGAMGHGYIVVQSDSTAADDIVAAMAAGRFVAVYAPTAGQPGVWLQSLDIDGDDVHLTTPLDRPATSIRVYDARGLLRTAGTGAQLTYTALGDEGYLVFELRGADGTRVFLQPMRVGDGVVDPDALPDFLDPELTGAEGEDGPPAGAVVPSLGTLGLAAAFLLGVAFAGLRRRH
jgi:predicted metal-dependent phosphoesterase TrpH